VEIAKHLQQAGRFRIPFRKTARHQAVRPGVSPEKENTAYVLEAGRRWKDEDIPKTQWDLPHFLWTPAAEMYGIQRMEYLDDVLVLSGAGVGGGSHVYGNTLYSAARSAATLPPNPEPMITTS
jgi:hypothetical protein